MHTQSAASEEYCSFTRIHAIRPAKKGLLGLHLLVTILGIAVAISASLPVAQAQALAKEYIYFGDRLVAVDIQQSNDPPSVDGFDAGGTVFFAPATIPLTATASDPGGSIASVEFYEGANLLFQDTTAPYSYNWTGVAVGTYSLTAKAIDNQGSFDISALIVVTVSTLPGPTPVALSISPSSGDGASATFTRNLRRR